MEIKSESKLKNLNERMIDVIASRASLNPDDIKLWDRGRIENEIGIKAIPPQKVILPGKKVKNKVCKFLDTNLYL